MILTRHNTLIYLVNLGVLTVEDIVMRAIEVRSHAQRNRGFSVRWRSGGVYVKQHRPDEGPWTTGSTVENEAALLRYLDGKPGLSGLVPGCRVFDRPHQIVVTGWVAEAGNLADRIVSETGKAQPTTALLARRTRQLHRALADLPETKDRPALGSEAPWALQFHRLLPVIGGDQSRAQAEMVGMIQQQDDLMSGLAELAAGWPAEQIIHGDMRWQNCLMTRAPDTPSRPGRRGIVFLDWEMAARGEPLWDLAGLAQSYIKAWLDGFEFATAGAGSTGIATAMAGAFPACLQKLATLWRGYAGADTASPAARRFSRLAGARLIQTIYEDAAGETAIDPQHVILLQFARNLVVGPDRGGAHLLEAATP